MPLETVFSHYRYDPLDRLASRASLVGAISQVFYQTHTRVTDLDGGERRSVFHYARQLLACQAVIGHSHSASLTAVDPQNSVLSAIGIDQAVAMAYTPYGHCLPIDHVPGFNGEPLDPITGHYWLGNGYRAYNPTLMRFNSPDSWSPFGGGGLNAYAYCAGDPVNRSDPGGHMGIVNPFKGLWKRLTRKKAEVPGLKNKPELIGPRQLGLADMPAPVMDTILSYLPSKDVANLRLVSRDVNRVTDLGAAHNFEKYMRQTRYYEEYRGVFRVLSEIEKVSRVRAGMVRGTLRLDADKVVSARAAFEMRETYREDKIRSRRFRRSVNLLEPDNGSLSSSGSFDDWMSRL